GEVRTDAFTFVTNAQIAPPRLEYVIVQGVQEQVDDEVQEVDVLAQVSSLAVSSRLLDTSLTYPEVEAILGRLESSTPIMVGVAKVLGYLDGNVVRFPRHAAMPGSEVHLAPNQLLQQFFSHNIESGVEIGTLINRPTVGVLLDPNGLRRHLAVIAQTGAGKSYTVGVILERLLELGGTIVVFDPNSDYVLMRRDERQRPTSFAGRVEVYRLPSGQKGRISDQAIGKTRRFQVQFSKLEVDEICAMTGISEKWANVRKAIRTAYDNLQGTDYTPHMFVQELHRLSQGGHAGMAGGGRRPISPAIGDEEEFEEYFRSQTARKAGLEPQPPADDFESWFPEGREPPSEAERPPREAKDEQPITLDVISGAGRALKYIERLERVDIWGFEDVPMDDLLRPMSLSVIDLAGVDQWIAEFVVNKVLQETWSQAVTDGLTRPVFIVLEEAHNFVPGGRGDYSQSAAIIKRIASEGRKFGIFLVLITQRPYRIHQDTLSQCNSQIIMRLTNPEDQSAVRRASESISEGLLADLPGLNVGEAVVLGPLVRVPVMVRVGKRQSQEGGSDIDVVKALERARSEVITEEMEKKSKKGRKRTEWKEEV
ncbi:MAG: ATP-binding protein, partial [Anaerolineae bacterium]